MKKFLLVSIIASINLIGATIDHIMNYTVEYNANPSLQGAISEESSVNYNPAGLMELENGTYLNGGLQVAIGHQWMEYNNEEYGANHVSPIPNLSVYKKDDKKALYWTLGGIAGGAELDYKDGIATYDVLGNSSYSFIGTASDDSWAKGSSTYYQTTLGSAFKLNDKFSMAIGGRAVYAIRDFQGELEVEGAGLGSGQTATIDAERKATGFGAQLGLNYKATDKLNIGLRYDSKVKLNFKTKSTESKINLTALSTTFGYSNLYGEYADGASGYRDLPAILALGVQYDLTNKYTIYTGANYYFNEDANIDEKFVTADKKIDSRKYKDGWELSIGNQYKLTDKFSILSGVNYAKTGASSVNYRDSEYAINSLMIGLGAKYKYSETLEFVGALSHYFYESDEGKTLGKTVEYNKDITNVGFGLTKKI